ncbi:hypothetical protein CNMCM6936_002253 [Aspergillus lentulus]|uniref:Uncharacterized protein n=1 Tax=Aspergillus lentulus TaxID=293939 RepID=A0AAN6BLQ8_ASPLE|nr:hypothetical protein CNMCM6069_002283 [Aspergillus lentulus]KAF4162357.1 hypothetical protein CNMCM6936_002253 [Aspergillus lentulus]KAF4179673.1 hypothetical protein CNMCM7927_001780 [Aspergillus lentulus]KAF4201911.1 hypothetical protein CNMCM8927_000937 [Aspergillus lentulus]GFG12022.1 hypothetical protein IFM61392_07198 [Aspergillus lentulus]
MDISTRMDLFQRALYQSRDLFPGPGFYTGLEFYSHEERANTPTLEATVAESATHRIDPLTPLRPTVGLSPYPKFDDASATRAQLMGGRPSLPVSQSRLPVGLSSRPDYQGVPASQLIHGPSPLSATPSAPEHQPRAKFEPFVLCSTQGSLDQSAVPSSVRSSSSVEHKHLGINTNKNLVKTEPEPADDQTTPHGDQTYWSLENLPEVLYVLRPKTDYRKSRHRVYKTTSAITGKQINDFAVLPSQISSNVEGWRLEAWMRLDRRITQQDIIDRVNPKYKLTAEEIESRREDFRSAFHVANWNVQKSVWDIDRMLKAIGVDTQKNSTRGLTPGLIDPSKGEAGGRIPLPGENIIHMKQARMNIEPTSRCSGEMGEGCRLGPLHTSQADLRMEPSSREIEAEQRISQQGFAMDTNARATSSSQNKTVDSTHADFEYPDVDSLTHCTEPSTQPFHDEDDTVGRKMSLQRFLKRNNISYEDWLLRDYDAVDRDTLKRGRNKDLESQDPANITASSKRRRVHSPEIETSLTTDNNRKRRRGEDVNVDESAAGSDASTKRRSIERSNTGKSAKKSSDDFWATVLKG